MSVLICLIIAGSFSALGLNDWWEPVGLQDNALCTTEEDNFQSITIHHTRPCLGPLTLVDIINDFGSDGRFSKIEYFLENKIYLILTHVRVKNSTLRRACVEHGTLELYGRIYHAGEKIHSQDQFYNQENCF